MYKKTASIWLKHLDFFIFDLIVIAVSYIFACMARYNFHIPKNWASLFLRTGIALFVIFFIAAVAGKTYRNILQRNKWVELWKVFVQIILTFVLFVLYLYALNIDNFSRQIYLMAAGISFALIWCERVFWKHIIRRRLAKSNNLPQLLIICNRKEAEQYVYDIKEKQYDYFRVKGVALYDVDDYETSEIKEIVTTKMVNPGIAGNGETDYTPVVSGKKDLKKYLLSGVVDEIFISIDNDSSEKEIIDYCLEMGITVHIGLAGNDMDYPNPMVQKLGRNTVLTTSNSMATDWPLLIKRLFDIIGGLAGCIIMLIIYIFVAPKIKKADPGPVFFAQERIGKNGRRFKIYKFRSMYQDAEARKAELMEQNEMQGHIFKIENDPRVLPGIGKIIREYSIDEWPQFINVLKGDMSLVGTRPPTVEEFEQYEPHHKARLSFKPGITGLWQVSGRSEITDFEKIVELDNKYIREWSLGFDIKILLKTLKVVVKKEGAE